MRQYRGLRCLSMASDNGKGVTRQILADSPMITPLVPIGEVPTVVQVLVRSTLAGPRLALIFHTPLGTQEHRLEPGPAANIADELRRLAVMVSPHIVRPIKGG